MTLVMTQSPARSPTAQAATYDSLMTVETAASPNGILVPNAMTQQVMAETEAGVNIVEFASVEDLFNELDS